jgi:hypothetical protein
VQRSGRYRRGRIVPHEAEGEGLALAGRLDLSK